MSCAVEYCSICFFSSCSATLLAVYEGVTAVRVLRYFERPTQAEGTAAAAVPAPTSLRIVGCTDLRNRVYDAATAICVQTYGLGCRVRVMFKVRVRAICVHVCVGFVVRPEEETFPGRLYHEVENLEITLARLRMALHRTNVSAVPWIPL